MVVVETCFVAHFCKCYINVGKEQVFADCWGQDFLFLRFSANSGVLEEPRTVEVKR